MSVVLVRAIKESTTSASVVWTAIGFLAAFSAAGVVIGWMADAAIVDSVRAQFDEEVEKETRRAADLSAQSTSP